MLWGMARALSLLPLLLLACRDVPAPAPPGPVPAPMLAEDPLVLVGAGDVASCSWDEDEATAQLLDVTPGTVFTLGDAVYGSGTEEEFRRCYAPTWGRHRARTRPSLGNHEARSEGGRPYYAYFGAAAGEPGLGYYSYAVGSWHVVVLNSQVDARRGSAQERWLRADLAAHPARCTLAYWHRPRFSSGRHGSQDDVEPLWEALYEAGAEVVLGGHDHHYERFAPQTPDGRADPVRGIRQFVVGTGGAGPYRVGRALPQSEVRRTGVHGVLELRLEEGRYRWEFLSVGNVFRDSGEGACH